MEERKGGRQFHQRRGNPLALREFPGGRRFNLLNSADTANMLGAFRVRGQPLFRPDEFGGLGQGDNVAQRDWTFHLRIRRQNLGMHDRDMRQQERFFTVSHTIRAGQRANDVYNELHSIIFNQESGYEQEVDETEPEIFAYESLRDFSVLDFDEAYLAYHQFRPNSFQKDFQMGKMILSDFPCIYESLMMVYHDENFGTPRSVSGASWLEFVSSHYMKESSQFQDDCLAGKVQDCLHHFKEGYGIEVGIFDCYRAPDALAKIDKDDELSRLNYFLCYWGEHVFPIKKDQCEMICKRVQKIAKPKPQRLFIIVPPIFHTAFQELRCLGLPDSDTFPHNHVRDLLRNGRIDKRRISLYASLGNDRFTQLTQVDLHKQWQFSRALNEDQFDDIVDNMIARCNEGKPVEKLKQKMEKTWKINPIFSNPYSPDVIERCEARKRQFDRVGLIGLDIETCTDYSLEESIFTMRPYMVSIYGRLQQIYEKEDGDLSVRLVLNIAQTFTGVGRFDCLNKMILWMVENNFIWAGYDINKFFRRGGDLVQRVPNVFNYIVAHNGFGFDYRFMYEKLMEIGSDFHVIGDINDTKSLQGGGLLLYDFALIYKEKLKDLAKTFFPDEPDKHKLEDDNVVNLEIEKVRQWLAEPEGNKELNSMIEYNLRDAKVVYHLAESFFKWTFTTPFGHSLLPKMFYHSLSSLSFDMWQNCFFTDVMMVNRFTQSTEMSMKIGGLTQVYRHAIGMGIMIDVNSFYPSIMMNRMPLHYQSLSPKSIKRYYPHIVVTNGNLKKVIKHHNIYRIKFKFPEDQKIPTIVEKTGETLVMALESTSYFMDNIEGSICVFGETINVAVECAGATIKVFEEIDFIPGDVHRSFIEYCYQKRLDAKAEKDNLRDKFFKNMMNMCFGKHGQCEYPQVQIGTWSQIRDYYHLLKMDNTVSDIQISRVLSNQVPLFQLRYKKAGDELNHKGATVRIQSFIMEMARSYLMRMKHAIAEVVGWQSISYCDTDSIAMSFDKADPVANNQVQEIYEAYTRGVITETAAAQRITKTIRESEFFKKVEAINLKDVRRLDEEEKVPMLDEKRLGASKIEKYIIRGVFTGQKQYGIVYVEGDKIKTAVKAKGVPKEQRTMDLIDNLGFQMDDEGKRIAPFQYRLIPTWIKAGTGVTIYEKLMILRPTLVKRNHNIEDCTSTPFKTIAEQVENKRLIELQAGEEKNAFKDQIRQVIDDVFANEGYVAFKRLNLAKTQINQDLRLFVQDEWKRIIESRRRLMTRLPKIKYGMIQDVILKELLEDDILRFDFSTNSGKMISIAIKAIFTKRLGKKKSIQFAVAQGEERYQGGYEKASLEDEQSARIIVFTLFCAYICAEKNIPMTANFTRICTTLKGVMADYMGEGEKQTFSRWRSSIACAIQFLQCPIIINSNEQDPLDTSKRITTLWRFMSNLFVADNAFARQEVIDTRILNGMQAYLLSDTVAPRFNAQQGRFDYVLEVPRSNEQVQEILRVRSTPHADPINEEELEFFTETHMMCYAEPVYDKMEALQIGEEQKKDLEERRVHIAKMIIASANYINLSEVREDSARAFLEGSIAEYPRPEDEYWRMFDLKTKQRAIKVTKRDVIDFALVLQFFYYGMDSGVKVFTALYDQWDAYLKHRGQLHLVDDMVEVFQIIFQKPRMFGDIVHRKGEKPKRVTQFFQAIFRKVCRQASEDEMEMAEAAEPDIMEELMRIQREVVAILDNREIITFEMRQVIGPGFQDGTEESEQAKRYIRTLIDGINPTSAQLAFINSILLMKNIDHMEEQDVVHEFLENIFQRDNDKAAAFIESRQRAVEQGLFQMRDHPDFDFMRHWEEKEELADFIDDGAMDGFALQHVNIFDEVEEEIKMDLRAEEQIRLKHLKRMRGEEEPLFLDDIDLMEMDRRQKRDQKRMRRFMDAEAEEGDGDSVMGYNSAGSGLFDY